MATDARGHTVPAAGDVPARSALTNLSLSTLDPVPVTNTTTRAAAATALSPTTAKPLYTFRADAAAGAQLEVTTDGTTWRVVTTVLRNAAYTPVWGSSGTTPGLGNGTIVGVYSQDDAFVDFECTLTIGSTSTVGTGNYTLSVPVAPAGGSSARWTFWGSLLDASTANLYKFPTQVIGGATTMSLFSLAFPVGTLTAAAPAVPAVGDVYFVHGRYRWA